MADRRYKLLKQGLPGGRSFEQPDLSDNDIPQWNATTGLWENTSIAALESQLDISSLSGTLDHGALGGLGDDDHPQYYLADGSRELSGQMFFEASTEDKISLFDNRLGASNMYGFGVETSTLYSKSPTYHRWYINSNADGGVSDYMELGPSFLDVQTNLKVLGEVALDRSGGAIIDSTANGQDFLLRANNSGGDITNLFVGNADSAASLTYAGDVAFATNPNGISIYLTDSGGAATRAYFRDNAGDVRGLIYASDGFFRIYSHNHGGTVELWGEDTGGTGLPIVGGDPDSDARLYYAGVSKIQTASDGAIIGNGTGDARLQIIADTDNVGEDDNAWVEFNQDGGAVVGVIGLTSTDNIPTGTMTGVPNNALVIANTHSSSPVSIVTQNQHTVDFWAETIEADGKEMIQFSTDRLRLNQNGDFTNGTYTPGLMRADGGFSVGAGAGDFVVDSSGNIDAWGTITVSTHFDDDIFADYGVTGGYGDTTGSGGDWGASIWSIGDSWRGAEAGTDGGQSTGDYGLAWFRDSHARADSECLEGLYVYRAGTQIARIGRGEAKFVSGVQQFNNLHSFHHASSSYNSANITYSGSGPSGGTNGDMWLEY